MAELLKILFTGSSFLSTPSSSSSSQQQQQQYLLAPPSASGGRHKSRAKSFLSNLIYSSGGSNKGSNKTGTSRKSFLKSLVSAIVNKAIDNSSSSLNGSGDVLLDDELEETTRRKPFYTSSWLKFYNKNFSAPANSSNSTIILYRDQIECSRTVNYPQFDRYMCVVAAVIFILLMTIQWMYSSSDNNNNHHKQSDTDSVSSSSSSSPVPTSAKATKKTFFSCQRFSLVWPVDLRRTHNRLPYTLGFIYSSFSIFRVLSSKHPVDKHELFLHTIAEDGDGYSTNMFDLPVAARIPHYMRTAFVVINVVVLAFKYSPLFLCIDFCPQSAARTGPCRSVALLFGLLYILALVAVDTIALVKPCIEFSVMNNFNNPFLLDYLLFFAPVLVASWCLLIWYACAWLNSCREILFPAQYNKTTAPPIVLYAAQVAYTKQLLLSRRRESDKSSNLSLEHWPIRFLRVHKLLYACRHWPLVVAVLLFVCKWMGNFWMLYKPRKFFKFSLRFLASLITASVLVYALASALLLSLYHTSTDLWPVVLDTQFQRELLNLSDQHLVEYLTLPDKEEQYIEQVLLKPYRQLQLTSMQRALNISERHQTVVGDARELFIGVSIVMRSLLPKYWRPLTAQVHEIVRTQIEVFAWVAFFTWTVVSCAFVFSIFDLCAHHRRNMLCAYRGDYSRFQCYRNVNPITTMAGSIRYMGYQTAYLLWSYIIQLGCAFIVFLALAELIVLPVVYDYWRITNFIVNTIVPLMIVTCALWYLMLAVSPAFILRTHARPQPHEDDDRRRQQQEREEEQQQCNLNNDNDNKEEDGEEGKNGFCLTNPASSSSSCAHKPITQTTSSSNSSNGSSTHNNNNNNHIIRCKEEDDNNNTIVIVRTHADSGLAGISAASSSSTATTTAVTSAYKNEMTLLALDNQRAYHIFAFYMFFCNAVIGLGSCFLRICKFSFLGLLYLGRLDRSSLPKNFEFIDKGHLSYVSFLKIEAIYTHPVMLAFISLLWRQQRKTFYAQIYAASKKLDFDLKKTQQQQQQLRLAKITTQRRSFRISSSSSSSASSVCEDTTPRPPSALVVDDAPPPSQTQTQRQRRARTRWLLAYTLAMNRSLIALRKKKDKKPKNSSCLLFNSAPSSIATIKQVQTQISIVE